MATTLLGNIGKFIGEKFAALMVVIENTYAQKEEISSTTILQKLNDLPGGINFIPLVKAEAGFSTPAYKVFDSESALLITPATEQAENYLVKLTENEVEIKKHLVCTAGGGTASTSDIRFKKDISQLNEVLGKIMMLEVIKYIWIPTGYHTIGISAQAVQKHFPELIHTLNDTHHTLTLEYDKLGGVIVLKALQEEVTIRRRQIKALKKRISKLEAKIK